MLIDDTESGWGNLNTILTAWTPQHRSLYSCVSPTVVKMRVTSRCVRRSVMSATKFHRSVVSACGHSGTTGTSRCVRCSVMSAMDFHRSVVSACGHNGTTGTSRWVRCSVMSANKFCRSVVSACVYIHICRNYFQPNLCELMIIK